ncbi:Threonine ammonia-lyase [Rasamsonia emersonii CBS 393.64]|uniref:Threonine ammonia-lyase n=1 Tax=Rasamsonia emersonii (strain ATCC 16479 / CBS 393.64 / IMI 116815) TaxID=1408163 RepID=A0A0F4YYE3_RASE3|nr:Threonine ammonia-lyase [Rasamsonia emersonii CBS 393.64]KKA23259.1 Threonine ammonia-lyase [Rasamsonia emersonii CBS 393.64]
MTEPSNWLPLTPANVRAAHARIASHIHRTPVLTCRTLDRIASTPQDPADLVGTAWEGQTPARPRFRFFFKCENLQRIGAFKPRGAFHAVLRLLDERGKKRLGGGGLLRIVLALALAAATLSIPAYIVMPSISTPSKIASTQALGAKVVFSGSTSTEREAVTERIQAETGAIFVPPYDHPDIILGQGTVGLELEEQYAELKKGEKEHGEDNDDEEPVLDAVFTPIGGGGLNAGVATYFSSTTEEDNSSSSKKKKTKVFGAEPSFEGADDCRRGLAAGSRIETVSSKTIADGLRTPVGVNNWAVISDPSKVAGVYAVSDEQIKKAMRLVLERMKVVVEPSAVVGLAVCLFDEDFRRLVEKEGGEKGWDVGIVFSGGNTTVEAIASMFGSK